MAKVQFHYELIEGLFGDKKQQSERQLEQKVSFIALLCTSSAYSIHGFPLDDLFRGESISMQVRRQLRSGLANVVDDGHMQARSIAAVFDHCLTVTVWNSRVIVGSFKCKYFFEWRNGSEIGCEFCGRRKISSFVNRCIALSRISISLNKELFCRRR